MVQDNSNKVLTVSYGAFSCSLEGFEDSFGMMTAVVEYFRKVSEQDRFFGTGPSKLTSEMLEQLAHDSGELNIAARQEDDQVILTSSSATKTKRSSTNSPEIDAPQAANNPKTVTPLTLDERLKRIQEAAAKSKMKIANTALDTDNLDEVEPATDVLNVMKQNQMDQVSVIPSEDRYDQLDESSTSDTQGIQKKQQNAISQLAKMARSAPPEEPESSALPDELPAEEIQKPLGKHHVVTIPQDSNASVSDTSDVSPNAFDIGKTDAAPLRLMQKDRAQEQSAIKVAPQQQAALGETPEPQTDNEPEITQEPETSLRVTENKNSIAPKRPQLPKNHKSRGAETLAKPSSDMFRLLNEAKEQMDEPETHRKRNALAHLRAAVAATLADKSLLKTRNDTDTIDQTPATPVRPKRPERAVSETTDDIPTKPLVLEMAQRVDISPKSLRNDQASSA